MFRYRVAIVVSVVVLVTALVGSVATAQGPQEAHAVVTALGWGPASGDDGRVFEVAAWKDLQENRLTAGQSITTALGGTAALMLPGYDTVLHLGDRSSRSELKFIKIPALARHVPLGLALVQGRMLVVQKPGDGQWLLVALGPESAPGYVLSREGTFLIEAGEQEVTVAVSQGEVVYFSGHPGQVLVDNQGRLIAPGGMAIPVGQRFSTKTPEALVADAISVSQSTAQMRETLYAFGLKKGEQWVERAEEGDLIPALGKIRGVARVFSADIGGQDLFDQPRSTVMVSTPRVAVVLTGTALGVSSAGNVGLALATSRNPGNAVVGQRLMRTRIIGNPGTAAGIRFNPQSLQLISLAGTKPRR
ncbi:MAG: hypothetical protein KAV82_01760 [Phycisphaerae bacterium]|nr:hypothetical protein [Phycisphaerae bacterium]